MMETSNEQLSMCSNVLNASSRVDTSSGVQPSFPAPGEGGIQASCIMYENESSSVFIPTTGGDTPGMNSMDRGSRGVLERTCWHSYINHLLSCCPGIVMASEQGRDGAGCNKRTGITTCQALIQPTHNTTLSNPGVPMVTVYSLSAIIQRHP